jgi:cyclase
MIVAKIKPGSEEAIARAFAESDATELPGLGKVRHRSIFIKGDLYIHLIETEGDFDSAVEGIRNHPLFKDVSEKMAPHVLAYDPETWRSPRDSFAREIYSWDAPDA